MQMPTREQVALLIKPKDLSSGLENWDRIAKLLTAAGAGSAESLAGAAATIAVETAHTFMPVSEYGDIKYFHKMYGNRSDYITDSAGLWKWRGRGFIQLTGAANYQAAGYDLKIPLVEKPSLACSPDESARIFVWFWRRHRLPAICQQCDKSKDWTAARKAVNGGTNGMVAFEAALQVLGAFRSFL